MSKNSPVSALERQREIFVRGISGNTPVIPTHFRQLEQLAEKVLAKKAFAYIAGGAGVETTILQNEKDFQKWKIIPRVLEDVGERDTSIQLFGDDYPAPFLLAPIGVLDLAHPKADLAVAKAAGKLGVPMIFSNQASYPMEETAEVMGATPKWFQLYWSKSNELVKSLVKRAEQAGCTAIVVTLDTTMLGWRPRDLDLGYLPFMEGRGIAQYTSDPVFNAIIDQPDEEPQLSTKPPLTFQTIASIFRLMHRYPGGFFSNVRSKRPLKAVRTFINIYSRPTLQWEDLPFLRELTDLPILLKGVLHPDDAHRAIDYGMNGIIVSNHGGRQVDGAVSSVEALVPVIEEVKGQLPVLLDSGIRSGSDIFKAIALGATAVLLGRPYVYGLAIAGQRGVEEVLKNYLAEFELTMGLAGCRNVEEIKNKELRMKN